MKESLKRIERLIELLNMSQEEIAEWRNKSNPRCPIKPEGAYPYMCGYAKAELEIIVEMMKEEVK